MANWTVVGGLDLGLFSDDPRAISFWTEEVALPFSETLQHSPTYQERFYSLGRTSSLKINYSTEPMPQGGSGYCGLTVARPELTEDVRLTDPAGLPVTLTARIGDTDALDEVVCRVPDIARQERFLTEGLGARPEAGGYRIGDSLLRLVEGEPGTGPTWARGFNYVVAFVDDTPAAHAGLIELGATHSVPPTLLPERCVFSWLRDPSGNWLELVQQAGRGPLPDVAPIQQRWGDIVTWRETGTAIDG
jgi:hypothetical protein